MEFLNIFNVLLFYIHILQSIILAHDAYSDTMLRSQYEHKYCKTDRVFTSTFFLPFGFIMAVYRNRNMWQNNISI